MSGDKITIEDLFPLTINLTQRESEVVEELAAETGLSEEQVMRQALRTYQLVRRRAKHGDNVIWDGIPE